MDADLLKRFLLLLSCVASLMGIFSCTSQPDERIPADEVMHFPFSMALIDAQTLLVSSTDADGKYSYGRLLSINVPALVAQPKLDPAPFKNVVRSNVLIPQEAGEIASSSDYVLFASRQSNQLMALPKAPLCNTPQQHAQACPGALTVDLGAQDPFGLVNLEDRPAAGSFLLSYLSSDRIDLLTIDNAQKSISITRSFILADWLAFKLDKTKRKSRRSIVRKTFITNKNTPRAKVYFLVEDHPEKTKAPTRAKGVYIVAVNAVDLLSGTEINDAKIEFHNLSDDFLIYGAQDVFVDVRDNHAYVLGRVPEALFKINLTNKTLVHNSIVCSGATSMAISIAQNMIAVPCYGENRVASYTFPSLDYSNVSEKVGRGPSFVVIDDTNRRIYCTFGNDGTLVIFDDRLNYLGHVFDKAPSYRVGS